MPRPPYSLEWYVDEHGNEPVRRWFREELSASKRRALGKAVVLVLQQQGQSVVENDWGKMLGGGLFEFRLNKTAEQILTLFGKKIRKRDRENGGKILLRLFCHAHGDKIVLLLGGYDKGEHPAKPHQQDQIALARKLLKSWQKITKLQQTLKSLTS